jgi:HSP20 family molecular chaperone IbpA
MRTFDLTPLYRSAIGFDRLANLLESQRADAQPSYPPYNIELVSDDKYRIVMALAGFDRSEVEIVAERDTLHVTGRKQKEDQQPSVLATDRHHRWDVRTDRTHGASAPVIPIFGSGERPRLRIGSRPSW